MEMNPLERFALLYITDSAVRQICIDVVERTCVLQLDFGGILRQENPVNFDELEVRYKPAYLTFQEIYSISFPQQKYWLNYNIINYQAFPSDQKGMVEFRLEVTGGYDNDTFLSVITITAKNFSLTGVPKESPRDRRRKSQKGLCGS